MIRKIAGASLARRLARPFRQWRAVKRGYDFQFEAREFTSPLLADQPAPRNALREFFDGRKEGPGIWKWEHYFDIYDRHLSKFRGTEVCVLEIGVFSGGSLDMWRDYFGPDAKIHGVDIEPVCQIYEKKGVKVFIGDQADRSFWRDTIKQIGTIDIVIDDGGHQAEQQIVSLEELLPAMRPGGVYICEDVHGAFNRFASYVCGLSNRLNYFEGGFDASGAGFVCRPTPLQSDLASVHSYPFVSVLERNLRSVKEFHAPKRGTQWQPFLD
jgi:hypothetical protein